MCGANLLFWPRKWCILVTLDILSAVALFSYNISFSGKKGKVTVIPIVNAVTHDMSTVVIHYLKQTGSHNDHKATVSVMVNKFASYAISCWFQQATMHILARMQLSCWIINVYLILMQKALKVNIYIYMYIYIYIYVYIYSIYIHIDI